MSGEEILKIYRDGGMLHVIPVAVRRLKNPQSSVLIIKNYCKSIILTRIFHLREVQSLKRRF